MNKQVADNGYKTVKSACPTRNGRNSRRIRGDEFQIDKRPFDDREEVLLLRFRNVHFGKYGAR